MSLLCNWILSLFRRKCFVNRKFLMWSCYDVRTCIICNDTFMTVRVRVSTPHIPANVFLNLEKFFGFFLYLSHNEKQLYEWLYISSNGFKFINFSLNLLSKLHTIMPITILMYKRKSKWKIWKIINLHTLGCLWKYL